MKLFVLAIVFITGLSAHAQNLEEVTIERSRLVHKLTVDLNAKTVKCLLGDYGSRSLKISLPAEEMRYLTMFRQTTRGETNPCINAGSCKFDKTPDGRKLEPSVILDSSKPTEDIDLTVVLKEHLTIDHINKTCGRHLTEEISSTVRAVPFFHADAGTLGKLDYDVCLKMKP